MVLCKPPILMFIFRYMHLDLCNKSRLKVVTVVLFAYQFFVDPPVLLGGKGVIFFQESNGIYHQLHEC